MTFVSYSQNCEDVLIWRALRHVESGFYIDVGAAWPTFHSVSRAFYDRGWSGINVEPNPRLLEELNRERPRDVNLGVAIGRETGEAVLNVMSNEGLSTVVDRMANQHCSSGYEFISIHVPMTTLAAVCDAHVGGSQQIHFLKVDAEGFEAAVLSGNDWTRFCPWVVIVEAMVPMSQHENHQEWEEILLKAGYEWVFSDGLNRYYVSHEKRELAAEFRYPPDIFDQFVTVNMQNAAIKAEESRAEIVALKDEIARLKEQHALEIRRQEISFLRNEHTLVLELKKFGMRFGVSASGTDSIRPMLYQERSMLGRLLFRWNGRPCKPLRLLLFARSGRPRRFAWRILFHKNRRPRRRYLQWMTSQDYQRQPWAHRV
jgi:FkbM family methyltransferase